LALAGEELAYEKIPCIDLLRPLLAGTFMLTVIPMNGGAKAVRARRPEGQTSNPVLKKLFASVGIETVRKENACG